MRLREMQDKPGELVGRAAPHSWHLVVGKVVKIMVGIKRGWGGRWGPRVLILPSNLIWRGGWRRLEERVLARMIDQCGAKDTRQLTFQHSQHACPPSPASRAAAERCDLTCVRQVLEAWPPAPGPA